MELIKKIYMTISEENPNKEVSKGIYQNKQFVLCYFNSKIFLGQFLREAQQFSQVTPYEINILFSVIRSFRDDE